MHLFVPPAVFGDPRSDSGRRSYAFVLSKQVCSKGLQMHLLPQCHGAWQCMPSHVGGSCALKERTEAARVASIPTNTMTESNERGWNRVGNAIGYVSVYEVSS